MPGEHLAASGCRRTWLETGPWAVDRPGLSWACPGGGQLGLPHRSLFYPLGKTRGDPGRLGGSAVGEPEGDSAACRTPRSVSLVPVTQPTVTPHSKDRDEGRQEAFYCDCCGLRAGIAGGLKTKALPVSWGAEWRRLGVRGFFPPRSVKPRGRPPPAPDTSPACGGLRGEVCAGEHTLPPDFFAKVALSGRGLPGQRPQPSRRSPWLCPLPGPTRQAGKLRP